MKGIASFQFYRTAEEREGILKEEKADFFTALRTDLMTGSFQGASRQVSMPFFVNRSSTGTSTLTSPAGLRR
jgi:hypothetical protein